MIGDGKFLPAAPNTINGHSGCFYNFISMGLLIRKRVVNWCPSCATVLANEQVVNGNYEKVGAGVTKKELSRGFLRLLIMPSSCG